MATGIYILYLFIATCVLYAERDWCCFLFLGLLYYFIFDYLHQLRNHNDDDVLSSCSYMTACPIPFEVWFPCQEFFPQDPLFEAFLEDCAREANSSPLEEKDTFGGDDPISLEEIIPLLATSPPVKKGRTTFEGDDNNSIPSEKTTSLSAVQKKIPPVDGVTPVNELVTPTDEEPPVDEIVSQIELPPVNELVPPIDKVPPVKEIVSPIDEVLPFNELVPAVNELVPTVNELVPPVKEIESSIDEVVPFNELVPTVNELVPPVDEHVSPVDEHVSPVAKPKRRKWKNFKKIFCGCFTQPEEM